MLKTAHPVLIVHRRLFPNDKDRYFVGRVEEREGTIMSVRGRTWVQDRFNGKFTRKEDVRTKIVGLGTDGLIIYSLPEATDPEKLSFAQGEGRLWLQDGASFKMDLSELFHVE